MARDRTRSEAAADQGHTPAFVTEPEKKVPHCVRCGEEVPTAKVLYTACASCQTLDLKTHGLLAAPTDPHRLVKDLVATLALAEDQEAARANPGPADGPVRTHYEALTRRGLSATAARRLAHDLTADPAHRRQCAICGGRDR